MLENCAIERRVPGPANVTVMSIVREAERKIGQAHAKPEAASRWRNDNWIAARCEGQAGKRLRG